MLLKDTARNFAKVLILQFNPDPQSSQIKEKMGRDRFARTPHYDSRGGLGPLLNCYNADKPE